MNAALITIFLTALALFFSTVFRNIGLATVFNPDALMIVCGGTIVAVFFGFPLKRLKKASEDVMNAFRPQRDRRAVAKDLLELARIHRKTDMRGLERKMKDIPDDFLRLGVNLIMNNQRNDEIRTIMEREMAIRVMDYNFSQNVLKTVARLTPSFGLAGTVVSLIKMFGTMQTIDAMAPLMAVAMMSTFYGVIISNLFMLPLCAKLDERAIQSEALMHSVIEGIEAINNGEHPLRIEERVNGYSESADRNPSKISGALAITRNQEAA